MITVDKNSQRKKWPKKDEKFEKWNLESIDDFPFSLQCLFTPSESEDITQLANEYGGCRGGCKLHITFPC